MVVAAGNCEARERARGAKPAEVGLEAARRCGASKSRCRAGCLPKSSSLLAGSPRYVERQDRVRGDGGARRPAAQSLADSAAASQPAGFEHASCRQQHVAFNMSARRSQPPAFHGVFPKFFKSPLPSPRSRLGFRPLGGFTQLPGGQPILGQPSLRSTEQASTRER